MKSADLNVSTRYDMCTVSLIVFRAVVEQCAEVLAKLLTHLPIAIDHE